MSSNDNKDFWQRRYTFKCHPTILDEYYLQNQCMACALIWNALLERYETIASHTRQSGYESHLNGGDSFRDPDPDRVDEKGRLHLLKGRTYHSFFWSSECKKNGIVRVMEPTRVCSKCGKLWKWDKELRKWKSACGCKAGSTPHSPAKFNAIAMQNEVTWLFHACPWLAETMPVTCGHRMAQNLAYAIEQWEKGVRGKPRYKSLLRHDYVPYIDLTEDNRFVRAVHELDEECSNTNSWLLRLPGIWDSHPNRTPEGAVKKSVESLIHARGFIDPDIEVARWTVGEIRRVGKTWWFSACADVKPRKKPFDAEGRLGRTDRPRRNLVVDFRILDGLAAVNGKVEALPYGNVQKPDEMLDQLAYHNQILDLWTSSDEEKADIDQTWPKARDKDYTFDPADFEDFKEAFEENIRLQNYATKFGHDWRHKWATELVKQAKDTVKIIIPTVKKSLKTGKGDEDNPGGYKDQIAVINRIWRSYGKYDAYKLLEYKALERGLKVEVETPELELRTDTFKNAARLERYIRRMIRSRTVMREWRENLNRKENAA